MHTFGWQCKQAAQPPARARAGSSRAGWEEEQRPRDEWELFQAVLGKPRTAAQRQQFAAAWKEWQAASARAERSASTGGGGSSSDRGPWAAGSSPNGSAASSASSGSSHSSSGSSSNRWTGEGSAGASAGPRWGQASWTWADMRQEAASSAGFAGWGDEEAWLRACYLAKARALHPDVHAASGERSAAAAEARFKEVQVAYEALLQLVSEPKQR
ncbi:hypothetical protein ABPG75_012944 [Micractinium tetrahymenae]